MVIDGVRGWEGHRVRLVPLEKDRHFESSLRWSNDWDSTVFTPLSLFPISPTEHEEWYEKVQRSSANGGPDVIQAIELLNGTFIGISGLHRMDLRNGYAMTGMIIGDPEYRGSGYGTEVCQLRAWYAFNVIGLRMLESNYSEGNDASRKMLEASGYEEVIRIPGRHWVDGAYRDLVKMCLTRERWAELSGGKTSW